MAVCIYLYMAPYTGGYSQIGTNQKILITDQDRGRLGRSWALRVLISHLRVHQTQKKRHPQLPVSPLQGGSTISRISKSGQTLALFSPGHKALPRGGCGRPRSRPPHPRHNWPTPANTQRPRLGCRCQLDLGFSIYKYRPVLGFSKWHSPL